jgi:threonine/homoserine/homoserine lactone efflux protein
LALLGIFAFVGVPCSLAWLAGGAMLQPLLQNARRRRHFDLLMAALLIGTALWLVWPTLRP